MAMTQTAAPHSTASLAPLLTPHGRLRLAPADDAPALPPELRRRLEEAFERGAGEVGMALPAVFGYWRELGTLFVTALCTTPDAFDGRGRASLATPPAEELLALAAAPPPMTGAEYLTAGVLEALWDEMGAAFRAELARSASVQDLLKRWSPAWNLVGRVHFNLAENRRDEEAPFAFLATYKGRLSAHGKAQHLPLGQALREYAGEAKRDRLLSLLLPVQRAAEEGRGRAG